MKIRFEIGNTAVEGTIEAHATGRDFYSLLPVTLTLEDYNWTEKTSDLPKKLSIRDVPDGVEPRAGDITYYAPWGNLAIFYKDFRYSRGLVKLGRFHSGLDLLARPGLVSVRIAPL